MFHAPTSETRQQNDLGRSRENTGPEPRAPVQATARRASVGGSGVPAASFLHGSQELARWHSTYGNQAVLRMLSKSAPAIQTKLAVNQPGDLFEQEADRVADQVMRMSAVAPSIQRKCSACEEEDKLQRKCAECEAEEKKSDMQRKEDATGPEFAPPSVHAVLNSPGRPLDRAARAFMEPRFGQDFGSVRLHTDALAAESARAVNALAYTSGDHIVFGAGQHAPSSDLGRRLLAHELTHVVQQSNDARSAHISRKDSDPKDAAAGDSLEEILPPHVGPLAAINRDILLSEIFGEPALTQLIREVKANLQALDFTRKSGILALLALADTRGPKGLDPAKAKAALEADEKKPAKDRIYKYDLLEARPEKPKSLLFNPPPPKEAPKEKIGEEDIPVSATHLKDVVMDPENPFTLTPRGAPPVTVNFAVLASDLRGDKVSDEIQRGRKKVLEAIAKVLKDLLELPPAPSRAVRSEDERVRARLKEALSGFGGSKPLRVFLSSDESEVLTGLALKTEAVFVRKEDVGDDKKLEAAIRVPLVAFFGSGPPVNKPALTAEEGAESMLHELVHDLLIRRGVSANNLWETIKTKAVEGPPTVKNRGEELIHRFLLAQEEVFVYDNVSKLGSGYDKFSGINKPLYEIWIQVATLFFSSKGVKLDKTSKKLNATEKVDRKKVDWAIDSQVPRPITVSGTDLTPLNALISLYPHA